MSIKNIKTTFSPLNIDPSKPFGSEDTPISKLKKQELELQIDQCHSYKEFKLLFFTFGSWQEPAFMPIFNLENQARVEERLDALTMALALKNHKRPRRLQPQPSQDKIEPMSIPDACHVLTQLPFHPHMQPWTQETTDANDWFEHQCILSPTSVAIKEEEENIC